MHEKLRQRQIIKLKWKQKLGTKSKVQQKLRQGQIRKLWRKQKLGMKIEIAVKIRSETNLKAVVEIEASDENRSCSND